MEETKILLKEEIATEFAKLREMEVGSESYQAAVDGLTKLVDREIEIDRSYEEKRDRFIKNCMTAAGIIVPVVVTVWGTCKSFEFEKEGTITTIMGRGFINKLLPKK